jgi:hypothetical protein
MLQDLKNACRALLKTPWFTCVTLLALALRAPRTCAASRCGRG